MDDEKVEIYKGFLYDPCLYSPSYFIIRSPADLIFSLTHIHTHCKTHSAITQSTQVMRLRDHIQRERERERERDIERKREREREGKRKRGI